jgi:hypothetical protein
LRLYTGVGSAICDQGHYIFCGSPCLRGTFSGWVALTDNQSIKIISEVCMLRILFGIFLILHSMVHLLYARQSLRLFELRPEMTWPDGSWLFSRLLTNETTRLLATMLLVLAALGLAASGLGLFFRANWWQTLTVASTIFSILLFFVMWDGDHGGAGILIDIVILVLILVFKWST